MCCLLRGTNRRLLHWRGRLAKPSSISSGVAKHGRLLLCCVLCIRSWCGCLLPFRPQPTQGQGLICSKSYMSHRVIAARSPLAPQQHLLMSGQAVSAAMSRLAGTKCPYKSCSVRVAAAQALN